MAQSGEWGSDVVAPHSGLLIGSYTKAQAGTGEGIAFLADASSSPRLVAATSDPSFIVATPKAVFSVQEAPNGVVRSWRWREGQLDEVDAAPSGGEGPCHLTMMGDFLIASHYGSGHIGVIRVDRNQRLWPIASYRVTGYLGANPRRQDRPRVHGSLTLSPTRIASTSFATDEIVFLDIQGSAMAIVARVRLPSGSGPRHLCLAGPLIAVLGELDGGVHLVDPRTFSLVSSSGGESESAASHIAWDPARRLLVTAHRRSAVLRVHAIHGRSTRVIQEVPAGGAEPRHFVVQENSVLVAAQRDDAIVAMARNADGLLGPVEARIRVASPAVLALAHRPDTER